MKLPRRLYSDITRTKILEEGEPGCEVLIAGAGLHPQPGLFPSLDIEGYLKQYPTAESKFAAATSGKVVTQENGVAPEPKAQEPAEDKAIDNAPQNKAQQPSANKSQKSAK